MLRWRSSVQQLRIFLVLLSTIRGEICFHLQIHDAVQVSSATAIVPCSSCRQGHCSSKGKHSSEAETEAEQPQSRPS